MPSKFYISDYTSKNYNKLPNLETNKLYTEKELDELFPDTYFDYLDYWRLRIANENFSCVFRKIEKD